jgi:type 1 glutamine amidotransferase
MKQSHQWFFAAVLALAALSVSAAEGGKRIKALLIAGGCCHDYEKQKDILKKGIEERANIQVDIIWASKDGKNDGSTKPALPIYGNPDYAKGYDVVIHDECAAGVTDTAVIQGVLKPHQDGIPGVNLHCAMHCYRFGNFQKPVAPDADNGRWYEYLGLQSTGHGPQAPIAITHTDKASPITKGLADWTTVNEELYNNIQILTGKPLARGKQVVKQKDGTQKEVETVVTWTNEYGPKKTRVFSTTIGHNNLTVADPKYLDLVVRGILWACGQM